MATVRRASIPRGLEARRAFWLEHARRCEQAGGEVEAYAAAQGLPVRALHRWREEARREGVLVEPGTGSGFVRLSVAPPREGVIRVGLPNGCTVEIGGELEPELIAAVLRQSARL